jgi:RNA polymerase sigma-70 factor (ECF subfamily)
LALPDRKNTCLNHIKKRKRRGETSLERLMESGYDPPSPNHIPERHAELSDVRHSIVEGLGELSESHREIITMRHIHELSYAEISDCLDIPKGTVMSRLHAARHRLRVVIETQN